MIPNANRIKRILMDAIDDMDENQRDEYFSAGWTDFYHFTTGQALQTMQGWHTVGNIVLRGKRTDTYTVIAGLKFIIPAVVSFRFDRELIDYLKGLKRPDGQPRLSADWLESLIGQPFDVRIWMIPDGGVALPGGVIGRVESPSNPLLAKMVDTIISDFLRRLSSVATKAARLRWVADTFNVKLADNSMRRSNDPAGFMTADVCAMVGLPSSNVKESMGRNLNPVGTSDHWSVMLLMMEYFDLHPEADDSDPAQTALAQQHAFRRYMAQHPDFSTVLLDTISLDAGVRDFIKVLKEFNPTRYDGRIDSGDLDKGARWAKAQYEKHDFPQISNSVSGGARAVTLWSLASKGVPFETSGVGEYFQFGGERQRSPEDLYEPWVNTEIVTKLGYGLSPSGRSFRAIKMSENPAKSSKGGILDRWRLLSDDGAHLLADVEVDLTRMGALPGNVLTQPIVSLRLDTNRSKKFPAGTRLVRPIELLSDGPEIVNPNAFDDAKSAERFNTDFGRMDESLKEVNGSHSAVPAGIEQEHYLNWMRMVTSEQPIQRIRT